MFTLTLLSPIINGGIILWSIAVTLNAHLFMIVHIYIVCLSSILIVTSTIETWCIYSWSDMKGITSTILEASVTSWVFSHATTMLAWEYESVQNISNSLLPTVSRYIASTSAMLLVINLWMRLFRSVLVLHERFSSNPRSTFPKENFFDSSHPYYWAFTRILTNLGIEAFTWVVTDFSDDAEALDTPFLEFGTSFLRRHHMRPDFFFALLFFSFFILLNNFGNSTLTKLYAILYRIDPFLTSIFLEWF